MGNFCGVEKAGEKPVKIIDSRGEMKLIPAPVTAAELMLDCPGYAVAPAEALLLTRRVSAAKADEVLVSGKAYLLVPVERVGCGVSDLQLAAVERSVICGGKDKKKKEVGAKRRRLSGSKVLPEVVNDDGFGADKSVVECGGVQGGCRKWGNGRPWTPVLEPIMEGC